MQAKRNNLPADVRTAMELVTGVRTGIKILAVAAVAVDTGTAETEIRRSAVPAIMETGQVMDARMVVNLNNYPPHRLFVGSAQGEL